MRVSKTIHEAYLQALRDVWYESEFRSSPRGQSTREILNYAFKVLDPVSEPIRTLDEARNVTIESYTAKEVALYDSGTNRVEDFAKASKFWEKLANPDNTVNSAYGYLIWKYRSHGNPEFELGEDVYSTWNAIDVKEEDLYTPGLRTPWEWAVLSLRNDKDTRQAILKFNLPDHAWVGNKDFPCTMYGNFHIRDDKLHFSVKMRSNDLMRGLAYDAPWFISLMDKMIDELKDVYPNLTKGHYTHSADSMHIYERDEDVIMRMIGDNAPRKT